jgi:hypothetical protein
MSGLYDLRVGKGSAKASLIRRSLMTFPQRLRQAVKNLRPVAALPLPE